jgi:hypothetical protein
MPQRTHDELGFFISRSVGIGFALLFAVAGCEAQTATAIKSNVSEGDVPNPQDPFGTCFVYHDESPDHRRVVACSSPAAWQCNSCDTGELEECDGMPCAVRNNYCVHPCTLDSECPLPATGNSVPRCNEGGLLTRHCVLPCDETTTCPDGLFCQSTADYPGTDLHNWLPPSMCVQRLLY